MARTRLSVPQFRAWCPPGQGSVSPGTGISVPHSHGPGKGSLSPREGFGVPQDRTRLPQVTFPRVQELGGQCGTPQPCPTPESPTCVGSPPVEFLKKAFSKCFPNFCCCSMLRGWTLGRCRSAPEGHPEPALVSPEGLELLLLSFRFPGKFGGAGDVVEDGNVFPWRAAFGKRLEGSRAGFN